MLQHSVLVDAIGPSGLATPVALTCDCMCLQLHKCPAPPDSVQIPLLTIPMNNVMFFAKMDEDAPPQCASSGTNGTSLRSPVLRPSLLVEFEFADALTSEQEVLLFSREPPRLRICPSHSASHVDVDVLWQHCCAAAASGDLCDDSQAAQLCGADVHERSGATHKRERAEP